MLHDTIHASDDTTAIDVVPARKPRSRKPAQTVKAPSAAATSRAYAAQRAERWSRAYTYSAVVLSSGLNAYAAATESHAVNPYMMAASALIGAVIPVLVWMLGSVVAWSYKAGHRRLSYVTGAVAGCVLALSVVHVAGALGALTGSGVILSALLAIGIDCGLVASEATAILVSVAE
jgi:hypothetical protein